MSVLSPSRWAAVLCLGVAGACVRGDRVAYAAAIGDSLAAVASRGRIVISVQDFAPGTWVELYVASPYTATGLIRKCFAGSREFDDHSIQLRDDITLLVFKFADGSIQTRAIKDVALGFGGDALSNRYAANATFRVAPADSTIGRHLVPVTGNLGRCVSTP